MTIICYDGKHLAADSYTFEGNRVSDRARQKIFDCGTALIAFTGVIGLEKAAIEFALGKGEEPKPRDGDGGWALVRINRDGLAECYGSDVAGWEPFLAPSALGVDRNYAVGMMLAGLTACEAVQLMCEHTVWCGGEVQAYDIAAWRAVKKFAEAAE